MATTPPQRQGKPNKWVSFATVLLEARFPRPPYAYRLESPSVRMDDGTSLRVDIGVYEDQALRAVVEVGELSREDKLELLESAFPDAQVVWIPKTELLMLAAPELKRFRLVRDGATSLELAIRNLTRERYEIEKLKAVLEQRLGLIREAMRSGVKAIRGAAAAITEYVESLESLETRLDRESLGDGSRDTSSDALLDHMQTQEIVRRVQGKVKQAGPDQVGSLATGPTHNPALTRRAEP